MLEDTPKSLAILFLVSLMFSIGLAVTWRQILEAFSRPRFFARVLLANILLVPLAGFALVHLFHFDPDVKLGFLFMAAAPGAPFALQFTSKTGEQRALAAALFLVLSVVAGVLSPTVAGLLFSEQVHVRVPYRFFVLQRMAWIVVPLVLGLLARQWRRWLAAKLSGPFMIVSVFAFALYVIATSELRSRAMEAVGRDALVAMAILILFGLVVGWLLGGPHRGVRRVLATGTSMRNVALGLLVAAPAQGRPGIAISMVAFAALMIPVNAVFTLGDLGLTKLQARRAVRTKNRENT